MLHDLGLLGLYGAQQLQFASERAALRSCCNQSRSKYGQLTRPGSRADPASQNAGRINVARSALKNGVLANVRRRRPPPP